MSIVQTFYDNMASEYDKLFLDWQASTCEQAAIIERLIIAYGFDKNCKILDCACGIGTQSVGLAMLGYDITASDISDAEIAEAKIRADKNNVNIRFEHADFCALSQTFTEKFDVIICMDNALPHMLTSSALKNAIESITAQLNPGGIFIASIRDYDTLLQTKPPYSPPYIHKIENGQRVSFQTWHWSGDNYKLIQYIIDDNESLQTSKFECEYRAVRRQELSDLIISAGCTKAEWKFPEETDFYQPIVIAVK